MILHRGLVDNVHGLAHQEYMLYFAQIVAEDHIQRAIKDGKLDDLSGMGRPLPADEAATLPPELRMAYRILKSAGYISDEVQERVAVGEPVSTPELLDDRSDEQIKYRQMRRLRLAAMQAGRDLGIDEDSPYYERIVGRVKVGS